MRLATSFSSSEQYEPLRNSTLPLAASNACGDPFRRRSGGSWATEKGETEAPAADSFGEPSLDFGDEVAQMESR